MSPNLSFLSLIFLHNLFCSVAALLFCMNFINSFTVSVLVLFSGGRGPP